MTSLFKFLDDLPIVRVIQLGAVIHFGLSVISYMSTFGFSIYDFTVSGDDHIGEYWNYILSFGLGLARAAANTIFYPTIMLALAEIIKLMKEKKEEKC